MKDNSRCIIKDGSSVTIVLTNRFLYCRPVVIAGNGLELHYKGQSFTDSQNSQNIGSRSNIDRFYKYASLDGRVQNLFKGKDAIYKYSKSKK